MLLYESDDSDESDDNDNTRHAISFALHSPTERAVSQRASRSSFAMSVPIVFDCDRVELVRDPGEPREALLCQGVPVASVRVCTTTFALLMGGGSREAYPLCAVSVDRVEGKESEVLITLPVSTRCHQLIVTTASASRSTELHARLSDLKRRCNCRRCVNARKATSCDAHATATFESRLRHLYRGAVIPSPQPWLGSMADRQQMLLHNGPLLGCLRRRNSVCTAQTERERRTEGAAMQTSKLEDGRVGRAAAAAAATTLLQNSLVRYVWRKDYRTEVFMDTATGAVVTGACDIALEGEARDRAVFVVDTCALPYDAMAAQQGDGSPIACGRRLAALERAEGVVTKQCDVDVVQFRDLCAAVAEEAAGGQWEAADEWWAAVAVLSIVGQRSDASPLLNSVGATYLHLETARALYAYVQAESNRRRRQLSKKRKLVTDAAAQSPEQRCLATWTAALTGDMAYVFENMLCADQTSARMAAASNVRLHTSGFVELGRSAGLHDSAAEQSQAMQSMSRRLIFEAPPPQAVRFVALRSAVAHCDEAECQWQGMAAKATRGVLDASTTSPSQLVFHAALLPSLCVPPQEAKIVLMHSRASKPVHAPVSPNTPADAAQALLFFLETKSATRGAGAAMANRVGRLRRIAVSSDAPAYSASMAGRVRTWLTSWRWMPVSDMHLRMRRARETVAEHVARARSPIRLPCDGDAYPTRWEAERTDAHATEMANLSHNPLALLLRMNDLLLRWGGGLKWKPGHEVRMRLDNRPRRRSAPHNQEAIESFLPCPLAVTCNVHLDLLSPDEQRVSVCLQLACHRAKRVVDVLRVVANCDAPSTGASQQLAIEWASVVAASASAASEISDRCHVLGAQSMLHSYGRTHRINLPDVSVHTMHTAYDVLAAYSVNMSPLCLGSAYEGHYSSLDYGRIPPGLRAGNLIPDERRHGKTASSHDALVAASKRYMEFVSGTAHANARPEEASGEPHRLLVGVHAATTHLHSGMERMREVGWNEPDSDETDLDGCLLRLLVPASVPLSQQADVYCEANTETMLAASHARADAPAAIGEQRMPLPDGTTDAANLLRAPLFPAPSRALPTNNIFEDASCYASVFFQAASQIALLASLLDGRSPIGSTDEVATETVDELHRLLCEWHADAEGGEAVRAGASAVVVAHALVLLNVLYPYTIGVDSLVIRPLVAVAPHLLFSSEGASLRRCALAVEEDSRGESSCSSGSAGSADELIAAQREWWSAFQRGDPAKCVWQGGVAPLLRALVAKDGSPPHRESDMVHLRLRLEKAIRAVWLLYSPDGTEPPRPPLLYPGKAAPNHPLLLAASCECVAAEQIRPVYVSRKQTGNRPPCRSPIGLHGFQYRQVLAMLVGAHRLPQGVRVYGQEGQLLTRLSSNASVLAADGKARSRKAISPVSQDRDEDVFGSAESKTTACTLSMKAFDHNLSALLPLYLALDPPMSHSVRARGGRWRGEQAREEVANSRRHGNAVGVGRHFDEQYAEQMLADAITNADASSQSRRGFMQDHVSDAYPQGEAEQGAPQGEHVDPHRHDS